jgi:hypothetical protein
MKKCTKCGAKKELSEFYSNKTHADGLESYCKGCKKQSSANQYNADNIKVLQDQEVLEEMPWVVANSLANEYNKPLDFVQRGLEACELAGVTPNYFIDRYLKGDKTIPVNESVAYQSKLLQDRDYNRGRSDQFN